MNTMPSFGKAESGAPQRPLCADLTKSVKTAEVEPRHAVRPLKQATVSSVELVGE